MRAGAALLFTLSLLLGCHALDNTKCRGLALEGKFSLSQGAATKEPMRLESSSPF